MSAHAVDIARLVHLVMLSLWGGVVATEAVIEVLPFRHPDLHGATVRQHYWIDLLVELPLVVAVVLSGLTLLYFIPEISGSHILKLVFAGSAVAVNLFCIAIVVRRKGHLDRSDELRLWRSSRIVIACFAVGLAAAAGAAILGFRLALSHLG